MHALNCLLAKEYILMHTMHYILVTSDVEATISSTASASTSIASANKKRENDRWPIKSVSCTMTWPSMKNAMDASYAFFVLLRYWYRTFIQTYSATSPFNPHREMDKTFAPSFSSSQITYVEAVEFLRFHFHRKRTASSFRFHIPACNHCYLTLLACMY